MIVSLIIHLSIFIIKGFRTIVRIFISTFWPICPPVFFLSKFLRQSLMIFIIKGSADMSSGLLQVLVELGNLHGTSTLLYPPGLPVLIALAITGYKC